VTVAVSKEIVLGFLEVSKDDRYGWIDHLYLDPSAVGLGLGTILLEQAKLTLSAPIRLYTFQENIDARRFYTRRGFKEIALTEGALNEERVPDVLLEWT
jgi:GNAT superfamily N-acetyltransferase